MNALSWRLVLLNDFGVIGEPGFSIGVIFLDRTDLIRVMIKVVSLPLQLELLMQGTKHLCSKHLCSSVMYLIRMS